jgi:hypothetical protein
MREGETLEHKRISRSKIVAFSGLFAAAYLTYGFISSVSAGQILHGVDIHLVRALLMASLAAVLGYTGGPSIMGTVSGLLLAGSPFGGASKTFLLPSSVVAGLVFDLAMRGGKYGENVKRLGRIGLASGLSGLAESAVVTGGLTAIGFPFQEAVELISIVIPGVGLSHVWVYLLGRNLVMSVVGGLLAFMIIRRRQR